MLKLVWKVLLPRYCLKYKFPLIFFSMHSCCFWNIGKYQRSMEALLALLLVFTSFIVESISHRFSSVIYGTQCADYSPTNFLSFTGTITFNLKEPMDFICLNFSWGNNIFWVNGWGRENLQGGGYNNQILSKGRSSPVLFVRYFCTASRI